MSKFIPVNRPLIHGNEIKIIQKCVKEGWISGEGPYVRKFENIFAKKLNKKYSISTSNGTSALEIALGSLNLKKKFFSNGLKFYNCLLFKCYFKKQFKASFCGCESK